MISSSFQLSPSPFLLSSIPWVHQDLMALDSLIRMSYQPLSTFTSTPIQLTLQRLITSAIFLPISSVPVPFFLLSYHVIDFNSVRTLIYMGACCVRHKCILQTEGNPGSTPSSGVVLLQGCNFLLICHIVQCRGSQVLVPTDKSHLLPIFVWPTS